MVLATSTFAAWTRRSIACNPGHRPTTEWPMNDEPKTFSDDELAAVTGAGDVDNSLQNRFKAMQLYNMRKYGFGEVRSGSGGMNNVVNPDMTNVIRFPTPGG